MEKLISSNLIDRQLDFVNAAAKNGKFMALETLRVLVIEDEDEIREFLVSQFVENGCQAHGLPNGNLLMETLEQFRPTLVLLDQMMPGKSGKEIMKEIRGSAKFSELPVMMVTGLDGEAEKIEALEMGADDYITKPFSVREVLARSQALVRRSQMAHKTAQQNIKVKDLVVDFASHKVSLKDREVALTLTEFKILVELLRQSGMVLTRDKLRERALGNLNVTDRTIDVHMASLRKKLEEMGDSIETVRGVGYRMSVQ